MVLPNTCVRTEEGEEMFDHSPAGIACRLLAFASWSFPKRALAERDMCPLNHFLYHPTHDQGDHGDVGASSRKELCFVRKGRTELLAIQ